MTRHSASIFSKVVSKESHKNTDQKVGLRQGDILKFYWLNQSKRYFLTSFKKNLKFRNFLIIWSIVHFVITPDQFGAISKPKRSHKISDQYPLKTTSHNLFPKLQRKNIAKNTS